MQRFSKRASAAGADAWHRYGNGVRLDGLNLTQALTYALARTLKVPLLYIGTIYDHTPAKRVAISG